MATKATILLVDDRPVNLHVMKRVLNKVSVSIVEALSGNEALQLCLHHDFALILLDVQMPVMSGFEVARVLRSEESTKHIPVLFITAYDTDSNQIEKAYELGAVDFIQKPIQEPILLARVRVFLELDGQRRAQERAIARLAQQKIQLEEEIGKRKQVEDSLREVNAQLEIRSIDRINRWQATMEAALDAIICTDSKGLAIDFNPAAERLFGFSKEEIMGQDIADYIMPEKFCTQHRMGLARYAEFTGELPKTKRYLNAVGLRADGKEIDLEVVIFAFRYSGSIQFTAFMRDVTDRKQLLRSLKGTLEVAESASQALVKQKEAIGHARAYTESIINSMADALIVLSPEGLIQKLNQPACQLLGGLEQALIGQPVEHLFEENVLVYLVTGSGVFLNQSGIIGNTEATLSTHNACKIPVLISGSVLQDAKGLHTGTILVAKDITEYKLAQEALQEKEAQLLAAEKKAVQTKNEFLAHMSHEIRTPMNAIIGLIGLALESELTPKVSNYLKKTEKASRSLLRIIDDILDFSKIEAGKLTLEPVHFKLSDMLDHLVDLFRSKTVAKNIELIMGIAPECPHSLTGDSLRLEQVLMNLISNAVKFTDEGEIEIQVKVVEQRSDEMGNEVVLKFSVRDTGIGMSKKQLQTLFDPFVQADSSITRRYGGTGLGLSISKRLVEKMDGQLQVESVQGKGSLFHFTVTLLWHPEVSGEQPVLPSNLRHIKVLVADDSQVAGTMLCTLLRGFGLNPFLVGSGQKAVRAVQMALAEKSPFHLVFLDWLMPELDGIGAAWQIVEITSRDLSAGERPKMILLTAFGKLEELIVRAEGAGLDLFLNKPVHASLLLDSIMDVFGQKITYSPDSEISTSYRDVIIEKIGGSRVLLVEDNEINQEVAVELLQGVGLSVEVANNGLEAIDWVEKSQFDVVLMDVQMPQMDGYTATGRIRLLPKFKKLPIIAMTAYAMESDRLRCLASGMNDHLTKPIDKNRLFDTLVRWIPSGNRLKKGAFIKQEIADSGPRIPSSLPGIDVVTGLQRMDQHHGRYRRILFKFVREFSKVGETIQAALAENSGEGIETARRLVHTVRGMAGNLAALRLERGAASLEKGIKENQREVGAELLEEFLSALSQVVDSIDRLDRSEKKDPMGLVEIEKIKPFMMELVGFIRKKRFKATTVLELIKPLLGPLGEGEEIRQLETSLGQFDFVKALDSWHSLARILDISEEL